MSELERGTRAQVFLDDTRRQHVEQGLARRHRLPGMVIAQAQDQAGIERVGGADLVDRDVRPAETGAIGRAQLAAREIRQRRTDGGDRAEQDPVDVGREGQAGRDLPGGADAIAFRNVETAAVGEQAAVFVELARMDLRGPGGAEGEIRRELAEVAEPHAPPRRAIAAAVGDIAGTGREHRIVEVRQPFALKRW